MPFTTRFLLFRFRILALLMAGTALASSCQSSRASFSFQAAPHRAVHVPTRSLTTATTDSVAAAVLPAAPPTVRAQVRRQGPQVRRTRTIAKRQTACIRARAGRPAPPRPWLHRPKATAEAGLGTTVFGVLGLVLLPIALLGLALSGGGLVWGIIAGAAALAVLVAYLDPFGG